jgi:hypothetical protein
MIISNSSSMENPGAPGKNRGPMFSPSSQDSLLLPGGATIGQTNNETLRTALLQFFPDAHTIPRCALIEKYAAMLANFRDRAGDAAINAFLQAQANK